MFCSGGEERGSIERSGWGNSMDSVGNDVLDVTGEDFVWGLDLQDSTEAASESGGQEMLQTTAPEELYRVEAKGGSDDEDDMCIHSGDTQVDCDGDLETEVEVIESEVTSHGSGHHEHRPAATTDCLLFPCPRLFEGDVGRADQLIDNFDHIGTNVEGSEKHNCDIRSSPEDSDKDSDKDSSGDESLFCSLWEGHRALTALDPAPSTNPELSPALECVARSFSPVQQGMSQVQDPTSSSSNSMPLISVPLHGLVGSRRRWPTASARVPVRQHGVGGAVGAGGPKTSMGQGDVMVEDGRVERTGGLSRGLEVGCEGGVGSKSEGSSLLSGSSRGHQQQHSQEAGGSHVDVLEQEMSVGGGVESW
ncbi:unnamed protein product, partial [Choristocarpus tenellus]